MILILRILLISMVFATQAAAQNIGKDCPDLSVTGMHSKEQLFSFVSTLKKAIAAKDIQNISKTIIFPLRVNTHNSKSYQVKNEREFNNLFSKIFTPAVINAIQIQNPNDLFCRDQGVMIGQGEVWINEINGKVGIFTINR